MTAPTSTTLQSHLLRRLLDEPLTGLTDREAARAADVAARLARDAGASQADIDTARARGCAC